MRLDPRCDSNPIYIGLELSQALKGTGKTLRKRTKTGVGKCYSYGSALAGRSIASEI